MSHHLGPVPDSGRFGESGLQFLLHTEEGFQITGWFLARWSRLQACLAPATGMG
jgi:hypothetical protein